MVSFAQNQTHHHQRELWGKSVRVAKFVFRFSIWFSPLSVNSPRLPSVQFSSVAQSCPTLCDPMNRSTQASLCITNSWSSLKLICIESVMPSNHLIFCRPLLLLPPIPPSIRVFANESTVHMRWPKYWSFSFNISTSNEHPGLIYLRMHWLSLLAVQGTLKSLPQHHAPKHQFFGPQLSL